MIPEVVEGMRIAVLTDVHANLPALRAALDAVDRRGADAVYHAGDAVGMGPFPAECLDVLLSRPNTHCVLGNHDAWLAFGLPRPRPAWMSEGEEAHQQWTHAQVPDAARRAVAGWPWEIRADVGGLPIAVLHYARQGRDFAPVDPLLASGAEADARFGAQAAALTFYGHTHARADLHGARARYVNPGALGCGPDAAARYALLDVHGSGAYQLSLEAAPYDPAPLRAAFDTRQVPERDFIRRVFMPQAGAPAPEVRC